MTQIELIPGTNRDVSKSQWFSPPELAQRVVEWAGVRAQAEVDMYRPMRVLEPSAGNGALVRPLVAAGAEVCAIELDERYSSDLRCALGSWNPLFCPSDFLSWGAGIAFGYDLVVMNPPYEDGLDVTFILHALKFAPRVVGIFRSQILHGKARKRELWTKVRPTRIAFLSERPDFGGDYGAMSDFVVLELVPLHAGDTPGPVWATQEWW